MVLQTRSIPVALAVLLALAGCHGKRPATQPSTLPAAAPGLQRFEYAQVRMGVQMRLVLYAPDEQTAETAARAAYHRVTEIDDVASDYRVDSELKRVCAAAGGPAVKVSDEMFLLLKTALEMSDLSNGGFDITCGPIVKLWRIARKDQKLPPKEEIAKALKLVGYQKIHLDESNHTVRLDTPGMQLDMGGIAKGYAGDLAIEAMKANGVNSALFECGGDLVVSDSPPGQPGWIISVIDPRPNPRPKKVLLHNCAISTTGDTEQFVIIDGKRYSHVVDPRTGYGLTSRVMCTVIAPSGLLSDPLGKVICFLGEESAGRVTRRYPRVKYTLRVAED